MNSSTGFSRVDTIINLKLKHYGWKNKVFWRRTWGIPRIIMEKLQLAERDYEKLKVV